MPDSLVKRRGLCYLMKEDFKSLYKLFATAYDSQRINTGDFDIDGLPKDVFLAALRMKIVSLQVNETYEDLLGGFQVKIDWSMLLECIPYLDDRKNFVVVKRNLEHLEGILEQIEENLTENIYKYLN